MGDVVGGERVQPERLGDDAPEVGEAGEVGFVEQPGCADDGVDLGCCFLEHVGVAEKESHCPLDGAGGGVGPCL